MGKKAIKRQLRALTAAFQAQNAQIATLYDLLGVNEPAPEESLVEETPYIFNAEQRRRMN